MSSHFNIDDFLKQSIDGFELQPRVNSFDAVMQKLARKKRRRVVFFFFLGAGSLILSLVALLSTSAEKRFETTNVRVTAPTITNTKKQSNKKPFHHTRSNAATPHQLQTIKYTASSTPVLHALKNTLQAVQNSGVTNSGSETMVAQPIELVQNKPETIEQNKNSQLLNVPPAEPVASSPGETISDSSVVADTINLSSGKIKTTLSATPLPLTTDSPVTAKKTRRFMFGVHVNPQYSSLFIRENKNRNPEYNNSYPANFADSYLQSRREQNKFNFNYSLGLKFGYQFNDKWELWVNGGIQRIVYFEDVLTVYQGNTLTGTFIPGIANNTKSTQNGYKNEFYYRTVGVNFSRTIAPNPFLKLKFDFGLTGNSLFFSRTTFVSTPNTAFGNYNGGVAQTSNWTCSANFKLGLAKELTNRIHYRVSPGLYFTPTSMFKKDYIIKQNSYGFEIEAALIFIIF